MTFYADFPKKNHVLICYEYVHAGSLPEPLEKKKNKFVCLGVTDIIRLRDEHNPDVPPLDWNIVCVDICM